MTGGFPFDEQQGSAVTADGVRLRTVHLQPGAAASPGLALVVAPGFSCSWEKTFVRRVARWFSAYAGVLVVDLRGQGRSGGLCTLGDDEALDVDAAVGAVRRLGYGMVATVGFSMGGAAVVRQAGLFGERTTEPVDAVVSVSAASRWWRVDTPRMRRLERLATTAAGRAVTRRVLGTRIDPGAHRRQPASPEEVVGRIAPVPLLVVHGDRDPYLLPANAVELHAAARDPRELWIWPGYGHAELALTREHVERIADHLATVLTVARAGAIPATTPPPASASGPPPRGDATRPAGGGATMAQP